MKQHQDLTIITLPAGGGGRAELREAVRAAERALVGDAPADPGGAQVVLWDEREGRPLGAIRVGPMPGPGAVAPRPEPRGAALADRGFLVPEARGRGLEALLLYVAVRQARRGGARAVVVGTGGEARTLGAKDGYAAAVLRAPLVKGAPARGADGVEGDPGARWACSTAHEAGHRAFVALPPELQAFVAERLFVEELEATVRGRCADFHRAGFFRRIIDGTLTRQQYVESVANNHQFVRWTTRLLGRMVGITADKELRHHYLQHLKGEIDHEVLLENDLAHLGADVDYVKDDMVPAAPIQQFMYVQESLAGFHADPVLFLAVPFSIESATAFLTREFVGALKSCIASWGIEHPGRACTFLTSHIHTDGGEDGHWEATRVVLRRHLRTERKLQQALNVVHLVMDSITRAYDDYASLPTADGLAPATDPGR